MLDAGKDHGVDLTGGYYDAGDNVKFNFPAAGAMTLLAWSGVEFAEGYKKAEQWKYILEAVKWGTDYFIKCHTAKNELYGQVGDGTIDHSHWYPPEYINYNYPSYKISESSPGSELAAETAASLAAASIMFKSEDSSYSATLLKHAIELYDFADKYRGDYTKSIPATGFYSSYSGYTDELVWGAAWLLKATGEEKYREKFDAIAEAEYGEQDPKKYDRVTEPISWDDKRPGAYILIAEITGEEKHMAQAYKYCDAILKNPRTPGGLFYDKGLSQWASNRYASNAAAVLAVFANHLPESDPKRKEYINFVKSQMDYILGDNPAGVNYVVGAEENSPIAVHHRGASATFDCGTKPLYNMRTLYGALAGGPGADDSYTDTRNNYQMNEVALDYNAGFTLCLASLVHFGFGVPDGKLDFDRAWPPKPPTPDINVKFDEMSSNIIISTGSGMICSGWCVSFKTEFDIQGVMDSFAISLDKSKVIICNKRETYFLDGEGNPQSAKLSFKDYSVKFKLPDEVEVLCDGYHAPDSNGKPTYKPEYGHSYKVTLPGGPEKTKPLYEMTKCWPSFVC